MLLYIHKNITQPLKKEWNNAICSHLEGPGDYYTKRSKSDRERQRSYDITYTQNIKKWYKWTYLQKRNRLTDLENELMVTRGKAGRRDRLRVWGFCVHADILRIDNQQGSTVSPKELCSLFCDNLNGKSIWRRTKK